MSAPEIDPDIQRVLPEKDRVEPPAFDFDAPEWLEAILRALADLFWVGLIVAGIVILFLFIREMRLSPGRKAAPAPTPVQARTAERAAPATDIDPDMATIDALAAEGRFAEALHRLLAICDLILDRRSRAEVRPSSTSRELASGAKLGEAGLGAYRRIVRAVEGTRFGGAPADEPLYRSAREAFDAFAASIRSAPA